MLLENTFSQKFMSYDSNKAQNKAEDTNIDTKQVFLLTSLKKPKLAGVDGAQYIWNTLDRKFNTQAKHGKGFKRLPAFKKRDLNKKISGS